MKVRLMMVREGRQKKVNITGPASAFAFMRDKAAQLDREHFWRIDLDARNNVLGFEVVSIGTVTASLVHPREVFKGAFLNNAAAIIVAHNHPSQTTDPSPEDREVTNRLKKAGALLGVELLDHMVLADDHYYSFKEAGLI